MSLRRAFAAAAILLAATYLKVCIPKFSAEAMPVLREILAEDQFAVSLPEAWEAWFRWY